MFCISCFTHEHIDIRFLSISVLRAWGSREYPVSKCCIIREICNEHARSWLYNYFTDANHMARYIYVFDGWDLHVVWPA